ncbi:MAG: secondary thiamine-phosphate synthase enzyme YjbQ [Spirochaetota bacterium]
MKALTVKTNAADQFIEITDDVKKAIKESGVIDGICVIFTPHTTAGITINENADPDVQSDMIKGLNALNCEKLSFRHAEGNSPAHIKSSIVGCSETVIVTGGVPVLGTWQGIYFCEFDGPRTRKVFIQVK